MATREDTHMAVDTMAAAQARIDAAEQGLWHAREELLRWKRPSWAQRAADVADWFSDEDRVYDSLEEPRAQAR